MEIHWNLKIENWDFTIRRLLQLHFMTKILAIDYGLRKTGVAFFDGNLIRTLDVIREGALISKLSQYVHNLNVDKILIGIPESGPLVPLVEKLADQLKTITGVAVVIFEETLTTQEAIARMNMLGKRRGQKKEIEDAFAASLLLEDYLESEGIR